MKMKCFIIMTFLCAFSGTVKAQGQTISPYLFGQNCWMPHAYGNEVYGGYLNQLWPRIKDSKVKIIRVGGIAPDFHKPTNAQFISLIDSIRKIGAEPLIQVPYGRGLYTAADAATIVNYINGTMARKVKFWSISNEPNLPAEGKPSVPVDTVESYIKRFASAMKEVDPAILIAGPECAWYDAAYYDKLIGGSNDITGKDAKGRYYVDIISFHTYPFDGKQTRASVVSHPASVLKGEISSLFLNIGKANIKNARQGASALKWAITEFNVNYLNPSVNDIDGNGVYGFLNGQFWAEAFGIAMQNGAFCVTPWSIHESSGARTAYDLGYLDNNTTFQPRSSYYHEMLMSEYFKGNVLSTSDNQDLVKTFAAADENQIAVMILNQSIDKGFKLNLNLSSGNSPAGDLVVNVNAAINTIIHDTLPANCTWTMVFDKKGNLIRKCRYTRDMAAAGQAPVCDFQSPYAGAIPVPGLLEVENFDKGGQNIAISDQTVGNNGSAYREGDTDIGICEDNGGGYSIGWIEGGEWLEYTIDVKEGGLYDLHCRVASLDGGGSLYFEADGEKISQNINVPATGGWQNWTTISQSDILLKKGINVLRLNIVAGNFNLNSIRFDAIPVLNMKSGLSGAPDHFSIYPNPVEDCIYLSGIISVSTKYEITDFSGRIIQSGTLTPTTESSKIPLNVKVGNYFLSLLTGEKKETLRFTVK